MTLETLNFWRTKAIVYPIIVFSLLLTGCKSYKTTTELETTFNKQEIADLQKIRTFFVNDIMELNDENFHSEFRNKIKKLEASGFVNVEPKKIEDLFNSISTTTSDEIWEFKTKERISNSLGTYQYLAPKTDGKYAVFLEKNTEHNSKIKEYYDATMASNNFSYMKMLSYIADNSLEFDLANPNIQIVMAIHYISMCRDNNIAIDKFI